MSRALDTDLQVLREIESFRTLGLVFAAVTTGDDGTPAIHRIPLGENAAEDIADIAAQTRDRLLDATIVAYEPGTRPQASHAMTVDVAAAVILADIEGALTRRDADSFDPDADGAERLRIVAARFTAGDGRPIATFYRIGEPLLRPTRRRFLALLLRDGRYDSIAPADTLIMRPVFDVAVAGGSAYFFDPTGFEQSFGFLDRVRAASTETFDQVTGQLRIRGLDELRAAATTNRQMMQMLSAIRQTLDTEPDYAASMTMPRLVDFVANNPDIGIDVVGTGDEAELVYDPSPQKRFRLLHLLRDDYLASVLTERSYEVHAKVRRT